MQFIYHEKRTFIIIIIIIKSHTCDHDGVLECDIKELLSVLGELVGRHAVNTLHLIESERGRACHLLQSGVVEHRRVVLVPQSLT